MTRRTHRPRPGLLLAVASLLALASCDEDGAPVFALDAAVQAPPFNPITEEKAALGRLLFFDPILSTDGEVACATCHVPALAYADGLALTIGVGGVGLGPDRVPGAEFPNAGRNSQTLLNVAFNGLGGPLTSFDPTRSPMFWDHRTRGLEAQVLEPIASDAEMRGSSILEEEAVPQAVERLRAIEEYVLLFEEAFGPGEIDATRLSYALATFLRTLVARNSPFDRYMRGDHNALTGLQRQGFSAFHEAECSECHNGPMFSDWSLRVLGVPPHPDQLELDDGAGGFRFRATGLRNVELTAPYMHNGSIATLEEVVDFYSDGDSLHPNVQSNEIERRDLSDGDRLAIVAFLESLTDPDFDRSVPDSVPSGLPVPGASSNPGAGPSVAAASGVR
ncbi:MAG: cytochrome c peroxidase [Planctomycetota bacterium]